ncbi:MAG: hypothetical protein NWF05_00915 [Candidatus Bathyarchaeota archaeon]|nr:hypothetical protein [Candidatus Bathyarchaeota archaeon]
MNSQTTVYIAQFVTLVILAVVTFARFVQTEACRLATSTTLQLLHLILPSVSSLDQLIQTLMFGIFVALVALTFLLGGKHKITLLAIFISATLIFSVLPLSSAVWFPVFRANTATYSNFNFTVITAMVAVLCLIFLSYTTKILENRKELLSRGATKQEIDMAQTRIFSFALSVTIGAMLLSVAAVTVFIFWGSLAIGFIRNNPCLMLVFGGGSVTATALIFYYYIRYSDK